MPKLNIIDRSARYLIFLTLLSIGPTNLQAQETAPTPTESTDSLPDEATTTSQSDDSVFSIEGANQLMMEADRAIDAQKYDLAIEKLQSARQVYNQLSNFYLQLFNSFSGLDNAVAESHRKNALDTSIERDKATYQLALVHRSQNQPELSIPLLIQIITSQSPLIGLGKEAYEQLLEIGFTDAPLSPPAQRDTTPPEGSQEAPAPNPENPAPAPAPAPNTPLDGVPPAIPPETQPVPNPNPQ